MRQDCGGVGFQAQVNLEARKINWVRGSLIYIAAVVVTLRQSYRTPRVVMTLDGQTMAQDITDITLGNGRWSGGGSYLFTPEADLADGFLDVCVARGMSKLQIVMLTPKVMRGAHVGDPLVKMARARRITIKSEEPLPVHADGELLADAYQHEIVAEVLPQKLEVIA
ncbi:MAG: hypothetical protein HYR71_04615 [Chloroflexi bacterium]|nr:hypothetical protein [Chloroflexota bacterium]